jgi:hypothetical protein
MSLPRVQKSATSCHVGATFELHLPSMFRKEVFFEHNTSCALATFHQSHFSNNRSNRSTLFCQLTLFLSIFIISLEIIPSRHSCCFILLTLLVEILVYLKYVIKLASGSKLDACVPTLSVSAWYWRADTPAEEQTLTMYCPLVLSGCSESYGAAMGTGEASRGN